MSQSNFDFDDERFNAPPSEVLPWCQMINPRAGISGLKPFGLAVSEENANAAGLELSAPWEQVEYEFGSGEVVNLYITNSPRLAVVRRGPVSVKDRQTGRLWDGWQIITMLSWPIA